MAIDGDGNILVANHNNYCLQKITSGGQFLASWKWASPVQLSLDIAVSPSIDKVYVVDSNNHHIQVLNSDLTFSIPLESTAEVKNSSIFHGV